MASTKLGMDKIIEENLQIYFSGSKGRRGHQTPACPLHYHPAESALACMVDVGTFRKQGPVGQDVAPRCLTPVWIKDLRTKKKKVCIL